MFFWLFLSCSGNDIEDTVCDLQEPTHVRNESWAGYALLDQEETFQGYLHWADDTVEVHFPQGTEDMVDYENTFNLQPLTEEIVSAWEDVLSEVDDTPEIELYFGEESKYYGSINCDDLTVFDVEQGDILICIPSDEFIESKMVYMEAQQLLPGAAMLGWNCSELRASLVQIIPVTSVFAMDMETNVRFILSKELGKSFGLALFEHGNGQDFNIMSSSMNLEVSKEELFAAFPAQKAPLECIYSSDPEKLEACYSDQWEFEWGWKDEREDMVRFE